MAYMNTVRWDDCIFRKCAGGFFTKNTCFMMSIDERASVFWTPQWNPVPLGSMKDGLRRGSVLEMSTIEASLMCV